MKRFFRNIRYLLEYACVLIPYSTIRIMPHMLVVGLSRLIGACMYWIPSIRKLVRANIATALPDMAESENRRVARESLYNLIFNLLEFIWMTGRPARIERFTFLSEEITNRLKAHVANGERIIFVNPHLGSWEASGLIAPYYTGMKMVAIAKPVRNPYLNRMLNSGNRERAAGLKIIFSKGAVKASFKALRDGISVGTLIDQNTRVRDGGVFVDFFGLPVSSSKAPAGLRRYCAQNNIPAVIIYGSVIRQNGVLSALAEWLPKPFEEYGSDQEIIQELMNISEKYIRQYPEQYLWFYKRFQNIPHDATAAVKEKYPYYSAVAPDKFYSKVRRR